MNRRNFLKVACGSVVAFIWPDKIKEINKPYLTDPAVVSSKPRLKIGWITYEEVGCVILP